MKNFLMYLILTFLFLSCVKKSEQANSLTDKEKILIEENLMLSELKFDAINNGNDVAYASLIDYYLNNHSDYYEILPLSILMEKKYNSERAYLMIYKQLIMIQNDGKYEDELLENLEDINKKQALYYLKKGSDKKNIGCINVLEKLYRKGIGVSLNIKKADSLSELSKNLTFK